MPCSFISRNARARLVTVTTGTVSAAPLAALATVALTATARSLGMTTACAPKASALRRQAPRLCGSVTPSSTSSKAGSGSVSSTSASVDRRGLRIDDRDDALMARRARQLGEPGVVGAVHDAAARPWRSAARSRARASLRATRQVDGADRFRPLPQPRGDRVEAVERARGGHRKGG